MQIEEVDSFSPFYMYELCSNRRLLRSPYAISSILISSLQGSCIEQLTHSPSTV
jgi:hypothetical protein